MVKGEAFFYLIKISIISGVGFAVNFAAVASSFSKQIIFNKRPLLAIFVPQLRKDGMHYEVNIKGYPRFFMAWSPLGRYDVKGEAVGSIPYDLVLAVSDVIEKTRKR